MPVAVVAVAAAGIGLPDLDQGAGDRAASAVQDPPLDDDPLPQRLAGVLDGQVVVGLPGPSGA
jgi:hypothetical protein